MKRKRELTPKHPANILGGQYGTKKCLNSSRVSTNNESIRIYECSLRSISELRISCEYTNCSLIVFVYSYRIRYSLIPQIKNRASPASCAREIFPSVFIQCMSPTTDGDLSGMNHSRSLAYLRTLERGLKDSNYCFYNFATNMSANLAKSSFVKPGYMSGVKP